MRVRDWQDIVSDVVDRDVDPDEWRAVAGDRQTGLGEDLYLGHPNAGLFLLKTYAKNPFEVKGVGTQVARNIDDEIGGYLPQQTDAKFAVHSPPSDEAEAETKARHLEETIRAHSEAPTSADDLFEDVMEALDAPAYGPMAYEPTDRPEQLASLSTTFEDAEELLDAELEDLVSADEVDRGFF